MNFGTAAQVAYFVRKVDTSGECWLWRGARADRGYGRFNRTMAHRYSYALAHGDVPKGMVVMHKCDNPPCVRPDHLAIGTQADNVRDMHSKGRQARIFGERRYNARITEADVRRIRYGRERPCDLARELGITANSVSHIRAGDWWKHVKRED